MITRIEVDGFKSLDGFELGFVPGLNILVGPNGSGKTNIVSFFEFLAHLMETDASEATSRVGGAGAVFRRVETSYEKRIRARLVGCVQAGQELRRPTRSSKQEEPHYCLYDYSLSLVFPDTRDSVLFEKQRLCLKRVKRMIRAEEMAEEAQKWSVDIESDFGPDGTPLAKLNSYDEALWDLPHYLAAGVPKAGGKGAELQGPNLQDQTFLSRQSWQETPSAAWPDSARR